MLKKLLLSFTGIYILITFSAVGFVKLDDPFSALAALSEESRLEIVKMYIMFFVVIVGGYVFVSLCKADEW